MARAHLSVGADFTAGTVPPRLFGSFVEHMGRGVYTGIFEPGHPSADERGFRGDVLDRVREIGPTVVRYPGGNYVSGHNWEDGIGPVADRPRRLDLAWRTIETNEFGLHEFVHWARAAGTEPMMAINLGTRGVQEALDLVEYANHPGGTAWSDLRRRNGDEDPFGIRLWCLGNEMDGPWQVGHKTAAEYGRLAAEAGRAMRLVDPSIELVACGSSHSAMPTFGEWERTVLELAYDQVDYISAHTYYEETDGPGEFLAKAVDMDSYIESVVATADAVRARGRHRKRIHVSFDEWNVWYQSRHRSGGIHQQTDDWAVAPRVIEDEYSVTDAVVVATMLHALLRHGERVRIACQAQLVNVIGMVRSEPGGAAWTQTVAHPFRVMREHARGQILDVRARGDHYDAGRLGDAPVVDAAGTWDPDGGTLALFLANRDLTEPAEVRIALHGFGELRPGRAEVLTAGPGQDRHTGNNETAPEAVGMRPLDGVRIEGGEVSVTLPPLSWAAVPLDVI
ncbi:MULTISPECIES: arabinosylfuranosidase ArfA [Pseudonocardia]|uniref:non-reducing end alpha-L-arabinofuranosidase n=2 Tax=Pseudonocardia TaxID=1847 RepID=A0A1Y2N3V2_PSEAH|nr:MULTISPECIES: alpha-N-arabinofuranosidase [Pseudonocardia]OSY42154.1 Intracellular exo-alpha-(1->5)-L-arabinofuranosidase [Pseudonocardia autotrophica]TDN75078.1 alpha-N-arabinofuranosidase [Pseudonocardia autotrophica]BBF99022.1 alpha-N-arabinofuranosidase [Pseudonocardia autotrophica]GEC23942.1 alpha-N-arabinofuranosidase [Pseudonocardia saturnea]